MGIKYVSLPSIPFVWAEDASEPLHDWLPATRHPKVTIISTPNSQRRLFLWWLWCRKTLTFTPWCFSFLFLFSSPMYSKQWGRITHVWKLKCAPACLSTCLSVCLPCGVSWVRCSRRKLKSFRSQLIWDKTVRRTKGGTEDRKEKRRDGEALLLGKKKSGSAGERVREKKIFFLNWQCVRDKSSWLSPSGH